MTQFSPKQKEKLKALMEFEKDKDFAILQHFLTIEDKLDSFNPEKERDDLGNFQAILDKLNEPIEVSLNIK